MSRKPISVSGLLNVAPVEAQAPKPFVPPKGLQLKKSHDSKIPLNLIDDSPYQQRTLYDAEELDNLGNSLRTAGQKEPIRVRETPGGRYELVAGHRRTRAARNIGWEEITAEIITISDREAELATMVSNEARIDLTDYERGKMYQAATVAGFAVTQADVAKLFGTSQANVSKRMAILKLPFRYLRLLDDKPDMFGAKCAAVIAQLIEQHPGEEMLIEDGVMRISEEQADQNSVKPWVEQMIKQKRAPAERKDNAVVTDPQGRVLFTAKASGRELKIQIIATEIDVEEVKEIILSALRNRA